jgi:hypothetical protein
MDAGVTKIPKKNATTTTQAKDPQDITSRERVDFMTLAPKFAACFSFRVSIVCVAWCESRFRLAANGSSTFVYRRCGVDCGY